MLNFFKKKNENIFSSKLFDERGFYKAFNEDLKNARSEVIIESPFITASRMSVLNTIFKKLVDKGVKVYVVTRDPGEHEQPYNIQSELEIRNFEVIGVQVLLEKGNHHRKLAIIDRQITWEGSLNILSHIKSREIMRRTVSKSNAKELINFIKIKKYLK